MSEGQVVIYAKLHTPLLVPPYGQFADTLSVVGDNKAKTVGMDMFKVPGGLNYSFKPLTGPKAGAKVNGFIPDANIQTVIYKDDK